MADNSTRPAVEQATTWMANQAEKMRKYLQKRFDESKGNVPPAKGPTANEARKKQGPGMWQAEIE